MRPLQGSAEALLTFSVINESRQLGVVLWSWKLVGLMCRTRGTRSTLHIRFQDKQIEALKKSKRETLPYLIRFARSTLPLVSSCPFLLADHSPVEFYFFSFDSGTRSQTCLFFKEAFWKGLNVQCNTPERLVTLAKDLEQEKKNTRRKEMQEIVNSIFLQDEAALTI